MVSPLTLLCVADTDLVDGYNLALIEQYAPNTPSLIRRILMK